MNLTSTTSKDRGLIMLALDQLAKNGKELSPKERARCREIVKDVKEYSLRQISENTYHPIQEIDEQQPSKTIVNHH